MAEIEALEYPRHRETAYKAGLLLQLIGIVLFTVSNLFQLNLKLPGIILFDLGVLLSAIVFYVWATSVKVFVLASAIIGIGIQIYYNFQEPWLLVGAGITALGLGGFTGKEAFCFNFKSGWAIMYLIPAMIITHFMKFEMLYQIEYIALSILMAIFCYRKIGQSYKVMADIIIAAREKKESKHGHPD